MSTYLYPIVGLLGWWCYTKRHHLIRCYANYAEPDADISSTFLSLLFPNTCQKIGQVDLVAFTFGSKVYHYPIVANADRSLAIGHELYLSNDQSLINITPPPGAKLTISAKDFGPGYILTHKKFGVITKYQPDEVINWPLDDQIEIDE